MRKLSCIFLLLMGCTTHKMVVASDESTDQVDQQEKKESEKTTVTNRSTDSDTKTVDTEITTYALDGGVSSVKRSHVVIGPVKSTETSAKVEDKHVTSESQEDKKDMTKIKEEKSSKPALSCVNLGMLGIALLIGAAYLLLKRWLHA